MAREVAGVGVLEGVVSSVLQGLKSQPGRAVGVVVVASIPFAHPMVSALKLGALMYMALS